MLVWNEISWRDETCFVFNCWRFHLKTFDYVRLLKYSIGKSFGWVRLPNLIQVNWTIDVRLSSITEGSIDYAGRMRFQLNSEIAPSVQNFVSQTLNFTFAGRQETPGAFKFAILLKVSSPAVP